MTESLTVDFNGLDINGDDEFEGPPVRRRGVTFEVADAPKTDSPVHMNGCDDGFQNAGQFMDDLDFLENCGGNNDDAMEQLQRKSLYVKFDPLCKSPLTNVQVGPRKNGPMEFPPDMMDNSVFEDPSSAGNSADGLFDFHLPSGKNGLENISGINGLENISTSGLNGLENVSTSGVNGLENVSTSGINGLDNHTILQDKSFQEDIPRSPVINGANKSFTQSTTSDYNSHPPVGLSNGDLVEPLLYSQSDMDESMREARKDFEEEKGACELDWQKKLEDVENNLKEEVAMRKLVEKDNAEKVDGLRRETGDMKQVLSQYELTIVELTENLHLDKRENEKSLEETIRSKEQIQEDLNTAEQSVCDAYKRIEKLKETVAKLTQNEETLKKNSSELNAKIDKSEEKYEKLKVHAAEKIDNANAVIAKVRKQHEIDTAGLQAQLKLAQSKVNTLKEKNEQKDVENEQLTQICDDLIKKVSHN